ncbi:spore protease YyaC [Cohnella pontilimi]|uniref:Spore protease YyaC n=1 Tax=Cohnella pontilimi TaxID=2564100 RepID=A0A4U0FAD5_9BACL|nr:spore protease YyaC [Cohnella pontilimi]TJY41104.1 spore protease YyaC [Cohnella pontilimi]
MKIMPAHLPPTKVAYTDPTASLQLAGCLSGYIEELHPDTRITVVCLGTDRSTGDSLGPLTGSALRKFHSDTFDVYGTLEEPVHAKNLDESLLHIRRNVRHPFIIGIDACLGQPASIGCIQIASGPIRPGSGVHKELSPVGDIHISGVVNVAGFMEYLVLQTTRLHVVMCMADLIARSVYRAVTASARGQVSPQDLVVTQNG